MADRIYGSQGFGSMLGGAGATNIAAPKVTENTVASNVGDLENSIRRLEELLSKFGFSVDQINNGMHRPPTVPAQNVKQIEEARSSLFSRLSTLSKKLYECNDKFEFELKALFEQLPQ